MSKQIRITVDKSGQISAKTEGYIGTTCKDATKFFENLGTTISRTPTHEMYGEEQIQGIEIIQTYD
jgi:hypothetical protein